MTGKTFRRQVYLTIALLILASSGTLGLRMWLSRFSDASRASVPIFIAVSAAWLTYCLQRRVAYTNALRSLWERMVETVQEANRYTSLAVRSEAEFRHVLFKLCCRIDEVRGIFRNVGEVHLEPSTEAKVFVRSVKHAPDSERLSQLVQAHTQNAITGVYPFESLKQIHAVIERLGFGEIATPARAEIARRQFSLFGEFCGRNCLKNWIEIFPSIQTPHTNKVPRELSSSIPLLRARWENQVWIDQVSGILMREVLCRPNGNSNKTQNSKIPKFGDIA